MPVLTPDISKSLAILALSSLAASCDISTSDTLPANHGDGLTITVLANRHGDASTAEVAAAVYEDGRPLDLEGGDLFRAVSGDEVSYLKVPFSLIRGYAGSIETDGRTDIDVVIVHDALIAREDRWYPVDLLLIDPGPGPLVGRTASASFPAPVTLTSPQPNTEYLSIGDNVDIGWIAGSGTETMQLIGAVECDSGLATSRYAIQRTLDDDDGFESIPMGEIIVDTSNSLFSSYATPLAQMLLQQLLNDLSDGNIDPDYVSKRIQANPVESRCEVRLIVQRVREGSFDTGFDAGEVSASSSADVVIVYNPPVLAL